MRKFIALLCVATVGAFALQETLEADRETIIERSPIPGGAELTHVDQVLRTKAIEAPAPLVQAHPIVISVPAPAERKLAWVCRERRLSAGTLKAGTFLRAAEPSGVRECEWK